MYREKKLRTVLMHDPELDDQNTIIRYLLYANEFQTEGLIYSSSQFHWKGDGKGGLFHGESEHSRFKLGPIDRWRWDDDVNIFEWAIDAYEMVYDNLSVHAQGYPNPNMLREKICNGNICFPGDIESDSPGADLIYKLILDDEPGILYLLTGAGMSTIGRALKLISERFKTSDKWQEIYNKIGHKVIIQSFGDQDGVYASYIGPNWPNIEFREMATTVWGYFSRQVALPMDQQYLGSAWTKANISSKGPLGNLYMVWGDGKQLHQDDRADYFGFKNLSVDKLTQLGYIPWCGPSKESGSWISEGDTSMYMNLLDNGLDAHLEAGYGGWGGRCGLDSDLNGKLSKDYPSVRWFGQAQRDFAARMNWSVTSYYHEANHRPVIRMEDELHREVSPGQEVTLKAFAKDPDGDYLSGQWWQYVEAGTYPLKVDFLEKDDPKPGFIDLFEEEGTDSANQAAVDHQAHQVISPGEFVEEKQVDREICIEEKIIVPVDAADGASLHFILEVSDYGQPVLSSYKRVVLRVRR